MKNWPLDNFHCVVMDWLWSLGVVTVNGGEAVDMPCQVIRSTRSYNIISVTFDAVVFDNKQAFPFYNLIFSIICIFPMLLYSYHSNKLAVIYISRAGNKTGPTPTTRMQTDRLLKHSTIFIISKSIDFFDIFLWHTSMIETKKTTESRVFWPSGIIHSSSIDTTAMPCSFLFSWKTARFLPE